MNPTTKSKPAKPYSDFPLFPHATRRWAKKIRGKLHYFGKWEDPDGALQRYLDQKDDLHAGRTPRTKGEGLTVRELVNRYLTSQKHRMDAGEITPRYFRDLHATCKRIVDVFGLTRLVDDLAADDFERLKNVMADTMGPATRKTEIGKTRGVFRYAYESGLIDKPIRYGPGFKVPPKRVLERHRQRTREENGLRMFEPEEIRTMVDVAGAQLKAMILLGINCGLGNHDCATLRLSALDLQGAWVSHPRPKTATQRRCPLWPETVQALREAIASRLKPKSQVAVDLVFLTRYGKPWVRLEGDNWTDMVGSATSKLLKTMGLQHPGRGFYSLRHTFETVAGETVDQVSVDFLMGHSRGDMASVYRERIGDDRLRAVTDHVRKWLFGETPIE